MVEGLPRGGGAGYGGLRGGGVWGSRWGGGGFVKRNTVVQMFGPG